MVYHKEELEPFKNPSKTRGVTTLYHISYMEMPIYEHKWITDIFSDYTLKKVENSFMLTLMFLPKKDTIWLPFLTPSTLTLLVF